MGWWRQRIAAQNMGWWQPEGEREGEEEGERKREGPGTRYSPQGHTLLPPTMLCLPAVFTTSQYSTQIINPLTGSIH